MTLIEMVSLLVGSGTASSVITFLGTRSTIRKQMASDAAKHDIDDRRVGLEEFTAFKEAFEERLETLEKSLRDEIAKTNRVTILLRSALTYIKGSHKNLQLGIPIPPLPHELEEMIWTLPDDAESGDNSHHSQQQF